MYLPWLLLITLIALAHSAPMTDTDYHNEVSLPLIDYGNIEPYPGFFPSYLTNINQFYHSLYGRPYEREVALSVPGFPPLRIALPRGVDPVFKFKTVIMNNKHYSIPEAVTFPLDLLIYGPVPSDVNHGSVSLQPNVVDHKPDIPAVVPSSEVVTGHHVINHNVVPSHNEIQVHDGVEGALNQNVVVTHDVQHVSPILDHNVAVVHEGLVDNSAVDIVDKGPIVTNKNPLERAIPYKSDVILSHDNIQGHAINLDLPIDYLTSDVNVNHNGPYGQHSHHGQHGHHDHYGHHDIHINDRFGDDNRLGKGPKATLDTSKKIDGKTGTSGGFGQGPHGTIEVPKNIENKIQGTPDNVPAIIENVGRGSLSVASKIDEIGNQGMDVINTRG